jgi:hypothetical protein
MGGSNGARCTVYGARCPVGMETIDSGPIVRETQRLLCQIDVSYIWQQCSGVASLCIDRPMHEFDSGRGRQHSAHGIFYEHSASVVKWSEFLTANREVLSSIPGATKFSA